MSPDILGDVCQQRWQVWGCRRSHSVRSRVDQGERIFDVSLNGKQVLAAFDIASESGGSRKGVMKEFTQVKCAGELLLEMNSVSKPYGSLISGIEIIQE